MSLLKDPRMKVLSRNDLAMLPDDALHKIEELSTIHPLELRVDQYVSKYVVDPAQQPIEKAKLIALINKEIRAFKNGKQTKAQADDQIDVIIGDRGMGGKRRIKRTNKKKRMNRKKRSIRRRK
jgi:hypothetical protein